ncbi:MAG: LytTR family DNA-binding domain-containing protein [Bacteroidota bacterium]
MLRTVIIEDEKDSLEVLEQILQEYCEGIEIVGRAMNSKDGIAVIQQCQPELVFLDIYLSGGDGFDVLDAFDDISFKVVFVTGYEQYAIKAIKYSAMDYLLKPVIIEELQATVAKARRMLRPSSQNLGLLKENLSKPNSPFEHIVLPDYKEYTVIRLNDISYIEAQRSYALFHLTDKNSKVSSRPLSFYESLLPTSHFFRIHKSYLINGQQVEKMESGRGGHVLLKDGSLLPVAIRRKTAFLRFLSPYI